MRTKRKNFISIYYLIKSNYIHVAGFSSCPMLWKSSSAHGTHPNHVQRRCFTAARGAMEILRDVPFYIFIAKLSAEAAFLSKHQIVAYTALTHVVHARSNEPESNSSTHANKKWVKTNNESPSTRKKPIFRQSLDDSNVFKTIKSPMWGHDQGTSRENEKNYRI